jgi:hypothetical protein
MYLVWVINSFLILEILYTCRAYGHTFSASMKRPLVKRGVDLSELLSQQ